MVAVAPPAQPCCPRQTLPQFLGLNKIGAGIGGLFQRLASRVKTALGLEGRFPGLQARPPLLPITDPANLGENASPAAKAAAEVKAEEDGAAQKVQALRYLATIGCGGCYPSVEDAFLAALDDCTEAVRYEAVSAIRGNAGTNACQFCKSKSCCSPKVRKKLDEIANKTDEKGCPKEPSARVRRLARLSLDQCGGNYETTPTTPQEGPTEARRPTDQDVVKDGAASPDSAQVFSGVQLVAFEQPIGIHTERDPLLARVNGEPISESHVAPLVEEEMKKLKAQGVHIDPARLSTLLAEKLRFAIDAKLLLQEAHRDLRRLGRTAENEPLTAQEIDGWRREFLRANEHVSLVELNAYYQNNSHRYPTAPQVKWERISVSVLHVETREQAQALIAYLRNRAQRVPCEAPKVDLHAADTKIEGWMSVDQISSKVVAQAVTNLAVGVLSPVLEDKDTFYLVRVLERRPGGVASFDEVADVMRREIIADRYQKAESNLIQQLRSESEIWTAMDLRPTATSQKPMQPMPRAPQVPVEPIRPVVAPVGYNPPNAAPGNQQRRPSVPAMVPERRENVSVSRYPVYPSNVR